MAKKSSTARAAQASSRQPAAPPGGSWSAPRPHADEAAGKAACTARPGPPSASGPLHHEAVRCARNAVLLERLAPVPPTTAAPPPQHVPDGARRDPGRTLSLRDERGLAATLAFLAGVSDDGNHVTAVCVEELPGGGGCKVLVAINKLAPASGSAILNRVHAGFRQMFEQLAEIRPTSTRESRAATRESVFNTIVALCKKRILGRLGLWNSSIGKKRFIGQGLEELLRTPWQSKARKSRHPEIKKDDIEKYQLQTKALLADLYELRATIEPKHDDVAALVRHIARYMTSVPLESLLGCLSNQDMDPQSRERLFTCFSKVARYRDGATYLCRRAKKLCMLGRTTVEQVQLPEDAFERPAETAFTGTVQSVLSSLFSGNTTLGFMSLPWWEKRAIGSASLSRFAEDVNGRLQESKIHAEIQIVAHYDNADPGVLRPRVIASSKDACYLCNALIGLQGIYSVPKSHGRLYPGWRLPTAQQFLPLQQRLNALLEREIRAAVTRLSRTTGKPATRYPNESTTFPLPLSASTLATPPNASGLLRPASPARRDGTAEDRDGAARSRSSIGTPGGRAREQEEEEEEPPRAGCASLPGAVAATSGWFRHEDMEVFLEASPGLVPEWLGPAGSADVLRDRPDLVVDVLSLAAGAQDRVLPRSPDGNTYFSFGERVVRINTRP